MFEDGMGINELIGSGLAVGDCDFGGVEFECKELILVDNL